MSNGNKRRIITIAAGDLATVGEAVAKAKARFGRPEGVPIVRCYEARRDGFWLHRSLLPWGVANVVVDASAVFAVLQGCRPAEAPRLVAGQSVGSGRHPVAGRPALGGARPVHGWGMVRPPGALGLRLEELRAAPASGKSSTMLKPAQSFTMWWNA